MRKLLASAAVAATVLGLAGPAGAVPPGLAKQPLEPAICGGEPVEVFGGNGRSAWVGDTLWLIRTLDFSGTFTPEGGGVPQTETFTKTYGGGPRGETVTCTVEFEEVVPGEGTFEGSGTVTVVAVR
jgi:hypothetical protein